VEPIAITRPAAPLTLQKVRWGALTVYLSVYALSLGAFFVPLDASVLWLSAAAYTVRAFGVSVCYHRYFAHRAFKTSRPVQFALALLGSINLQGGVLWWAETHRYHHRHADTPGDLHSPRYQGFWYSHYGWYLNKDNAVTRLDRVRDLARFPELVWLNDHHWAPFGVFVALVAWQFGFAGVVWAVCIPTVLLWEMTHWVQSFSHSVGGYRRWDAPDQSRNHWLLGVLSLGEFHNNHHAFSSSAQQGHAWWELDVGYCAVRLLAAIGIVWDVKTPRAPAGAAGAP
jgi:stearoyl-CoA desaturase (delta-9 desaturase)